MPARVARPPGADPVGVDVVAALRVGDRVLVVADLLPGVDLLARLARRGVGGAEPAVVVDHARQARGGEDLGVVVEVLLLDRREAVRHHHAGMATVRVRGVGCVEPPAQRRALGVERDVFAHRRSQKSSTVTTRAWPAEVRRGYRSRVTVRSACGEIDPALGRGTRRHRGDRDDLERAGQRHAAAGGGGSRREVLGVGALDGDAGRRRPAVGARGSCRCAGRSSPAAPRDRRRAAPPGRSGRRARPGPPASVPPRNESGYDTSAATSPLASTSLRTVRVMSLANRPRVTPVSTSTARTTITTRSAASTPTTIRVRPRGGELSCVDMDVPRWLCSTYQQHDRSRSTER